jgi:hypothetical protein
LFTRVEMGHIVIGSGVGDEEIARISFIAVVGVSGSILDGRFLTESPEAAFAAGRQAMVSGVLGGFGFLLFWEDFISPTVRGSQEDT